MNTTEVVRAWKDEAYREGLSTVQKAQLPEHPSGSIEFEQPELEDETWFGPRAGKITHGCHTARCYTHHCK
jgi:mersacidin/lichenicidin family type 2 lantibiotic